jgi:hypothetical protein
MVVCGVALLEAETFKSCPDNGESSSYRLIHPLFAKKISPGDVPARLIEEAKTWFGESQCHSNSMDSMISCIKNLTPNVTEAQKLHVGDSNYYALTLSDGDDPNVESTIFSTACKRDGNVGVCVDRDSWWREGPWKLVADKRSSGGMAEVYVFFGDRPDRVALFERDFDAANENNSVGYAPCMLGRFKIAKSEN